MTMKEANLVSFRSQAEIAPLPQLHQLPYGEDDLTDVLRLRAAYSSLVSQDITRDEAELAEFHTHCLSFLPEWSRKRFLSRHSPEDVNYWAELLSLVITYTEQMSPVV
jgi:hypothetical protein